MKTFPYYSQSLVTKLWIAAFVFQSIIIAKNFQVKKIVVNTKHPKMCLRSKNKFRNQNRIPYFTVGILNFLNPVFYFPLLLSTYTYTLLK